MVTLEQLSATTGFSKRMNTSAWYLSIAAVLVAGGCGTPRQPAHATSSATADPATTSPPTPGKPTMEYKSVEFVETSDNDIRAHMAQWAKEGWNVLSISPRLSQADGTVLRKVQLSRAKQ